MDAIFGIHAEALEMSARRAEVLASNLVNVDTPNYKARDIDFGKILNEKMSNVQDGLKTTDSHHLMGDDAETLSGLKYRVPVQPSEDGNTVDEQVEQSLYAENAIRYSASLNFVTSKAKTLLTALRGE